MDSNYQRNKDKRKAKDKAYYERNKKKIIEKQRLNRKDYFRRYNEKNREKKRMQNIEYYNKFENKLRVLKNQATKRNLEYSLTDEEVKILWNSPCHYCGKIEEGTFGSIDRKDNNLGYTKENSLPSCWGHNKLKGTFSYEEFWSLVKSAASHK
jgi:hypothetical protein